ncbi:MAG: IPT/TIG domain-containing protein [Geobacteraceae bacterium]
MARGFIFIAVSLLFLLTGTTVLQAQDVSIALVASPKVAKAGQDLRSRIQLLVANIGDRKLKDISVEIVLKKSPICPGKTHQAAYSSNYYDGVLLKGGRTVISLDPGKTLTIDPRGALTIPWNTPVGRTYYLCAVIDAENKSKSGNKNNCSCSPIQIVGSEEGPLVSRIMERCIVPGSTLTILGRNFGTDQGTITLLSASGLPVNISISSWSDSNVVIRIPDDSSIQEGQQYTISIKKSGETSNISAGRHYISVCPVEKHSPKPKMIQPPPPFFFDQQQ